MDQLDGGFAVWIQEMVNLLCQTIFSLAIPGAQHFCLHRPSWPLSGGQICSNKPEKWWICYDGLKRAGFVVISLKDQKVADLLYLVLWWTIKGLNCFKRCKQIVQVSKRSGNVAVTSHITRSSTWSRHASDYQVPHLFSVTALFSTRGPILGCAQ